MNDHQIVARVVYCMTAETLAAILMTVGVLTEDRAWVAAGLLPALVGLAAIGSVLRAVWHSKEPRL